MEIGDREHNFNHSRAFYKKQSNWAEKSERCACWHRFCLKLAGKGRGNFFQGEAPVNHQASHDVENAMPPEALRLRQGLLGNHIRNLSLPNNQPTLCDSLHMLLNTALPLRQDMEESLDRLKEAFLDVLHEVLREGGINMQERLVIGFVDTRLGVIDRSHPQATLIDILLDHEPMLTPVLRQIAADTLMLHSLSALDQAFALCRNADESRDDAVLETYQVCLKGELSHFYYA
jgi:hypothetical protein